MNYSCKRCTEYGKTWYGDDPVCAFKNEIEDVRMSPISYAEKKDKIITKVFNSENWNCATMNALRDLIEEKAKKGEAWYYRDDNATGSIGVLPFETEHYTGNLILTWYKDYGKTGGAIIVWDDEPPRQLTEDIAEEILVAYERKREKRKRR